MSNQKDRRLLISFFQKPQNESELSDLLKILLTDLETSTIANRIRILNLLKQNQSQHKIAQKLKLGVATVTHGHKISKLKPFQRLQNWWA